MNLFKDMNKILQNQYALLKKLHIFMKFYFFFSISHILILVRVLTNIEQIHELVRYFLSF